MRSLRLAGLALLFPTSLVAQLPTSSLALRATPRVAFYLDGGGLENDRIRAGVEMRIVRGWTLGFAMSQTRITRTTGNAWDLVDTSYGASETDVALRCYPVRLVLPGGAHALQAYVAVLAAYGSYTSSAKLSGFRGNAPRVTPIPDVPLPPPEPPPRYVIWQDASRGSGWQPGVEIGVRLSFSGPGFIDLGASVRHVAVARPALGLSVGDTETRLVAAVGVGW